MLNGKSMQEKRPGRYWYKQLIQFINENFSKTFRLQDAADKVFSHLHIAAVFQEHAGEKFSDYLLRVRMENAVKLLREHKNITENKQGMRLRKLAGIHQSVLKNIINAPSEYIRNFWIGDRYVEKV